MNSNKYSVGDLTQQNNNTLKVDFGDSLGGGLLGIAFFILVIIASLIIIGYAIQYTWNKTLPDILGIKEITLYQAIGLYVLRLVLLN